MMQANFNCGYLQRNFWYYVIPVLQSLKMAGNFTIIVTEWLHYLLGFLKVLDEGMNENTTV